MWTWFRHDRSLLGSTGRGFEDVYYSYLVMYKRPRPEMAPAIEGTSPGGDTQEDAMVGSDALYDIDADELFAPSPFDGDDIDHGDHDDDDELRADDGGVGSEEEEDCDRGGIVSANSAAGSLHENGGGCELAAFTIDDSGTFDLDVSLSSSVRNSANSRWSRIIQNPSKEKKGLVRLHLVRFP